MVEYRQTGAVEDRKHKFVHHGTEALVVSLAPLVSGVFVLGVAVWASIKRSNRQDEPAA